MYTNAITRSNPSAFLFLIDQSGSMSDIMPTGNTKAVEVAKILNRLLADLTIRCTRADGVRDYFDVGVLCYNGDGVFNGFQGDLSLSDLNPISSIERSPIRIDEIIKKVPDDAGSFYEQTVKFPVWFDPTSKGGTPMCEAITKAGEILVAWCSEPSHADSFPPTVLHISDGVSTDGDPEGFAMNLQQIQINDGSVLLFNLHLSTIENGQIQYPSSESILPDEDSKRLFRMSSLLPKQMAEYAASKGFNVNQESRGFVFNAGYVDIVEFLDIGTRASQLR